MYFAMFDLSVKVVDTHLASWSLSCAHFLIAVMPTLEAALAIATNATRSTYDVLLTKYSMQLIL